MRAIKTIYISMHNDYDNVNLQKLSALWETNCIVTIPQLFVIGYQPACLFHLFIRMNKITTFIIFNDIVADANRLNIHIVTQQMLQRLRETAQAEWKTARITCKIDTQKTMFNKIRNLFSDLNMLNHDCFIVP